MAVRRECGVYGWWCMGRARRSLWLRWWWSCGEGWWFPAMVAVVKAILMVVFMKVLIVAGVSMAIGQSFQRSTFIHQLITNAELEESPLYVPLHRFEDNEEKEVKCLDPSLSPPQKVQHAIDCLPISQAKTCNGIHHSFNRWTIMDYSKAYRSGEITPCLAFHFFSYSFRYAYYLACMHKVMEFLLLSRTR